MPKRKQHRFAANLLQWFDQHGRKSLPWQQNPTAYRIWVAEIMLQQTQVTTVIPYYERFLQRFPTLDNLAKADIDEVLHFWSGLGYYARGRNLHKAAQFIVGEMGGEFPEDLETVMQLPGIGRSTAAAILAQSANQRHAILDGNVKRVLSRYFAVSGWPGERAVSDKLWQHSESVTPAERIADYTQAIMDLGALVCTRNKPGCTACPLQTTCLAYTQYSPESFPTPKPKRKQPQRSIQMLMLVNNKGELLLQRRPPAGIWGGLLSFPEIPTDQAVEDWSEKHIGTITEIQTHPTLNHVFSHFRLVIQPVSARLEQMNSQLMDDQSWIWFSPGVSIAGLAAPVMQLIRQHHPCSGSPS